MKFKIIAVGKTKSSHWQLAERDYTERIQRYAQIEDISVKEASHDSLRNEELVKQKEGGEILNKIDQSDFVIALDRRGTQFHSEKFARFLQEKMLHGTSTFNFLIGGPLGLATDVLDKADLVLSLSELTFPHEMAKVVLLEQIYRALTIMKGEKYHK